MAGRRDFFKKLIGGAVAGAAIASTPKSEAVPIAPEPPVPRYEPHPPRRYQPSMFVNDPRLVCVSSVSMMFNQPQSYISMSEENRRMRS